MSLNYRMIGAVMIGVYLLIVIAGGFIAAGIYRITYKKNYQKLNQYNSDLKALKEYYTASRKEIVDDTTVND